MEGVTINNILWQVKLSILCRHLMWALCGHSSKLDMSIGIWHNLKFKMDIEKARVIMRLDYMLKKR